jgi:hypothetical protein
VSTVLIAPSPVSHERHATGISKTQDHVIALLIGVATFFYLLPFCRFILMNADEGVVLQGAQRILEGQIPYRDFFSFLPPLSFYWTAALFKLFGDSILVPRTALLLYGAVFTSLTYLLARRTAGVWPSLLAASVCGVITLPTSFYVQHNWESTLLATFAVYIAVALYDSPSAYKAFAFGALASSTVITNQAKGAGLVFGSVTAFALLRIVYYRSFRKILLPGTAGFILPLVVTGFYFSLHGALGALVTDVMWPLRHYSIANSIPYGYVTLSPEQFDAMTHAPLLMKVFFATALSPLLLVSAIPIFGIMVFLFHVLRPQYSAKSPIYIFLGAILLGLWLSFLPGRRDPGHIIYMLPLFALVIAWIADARDIPLNFVRVGRPLIFVGIVLVFSLFGFSELLMATSGTDRLDTRRGLLRTKGTDTVIPYLQGLLKPGGKIFVYPYQPLYYFLTATRNPTAYDYFQPGMHSDAQLERAIQQLEREKTQAVLFSSFNEIIHIPWPNTPLAVVGRLDPMTTYILHHYHVCASLRSTMNGDWTWLYMVRNGSACTPTAVASSVSAKSPSGARDRVR